LTYGLLLVVSGVLEFSGDEENNLPNAVVIAVFVMTVWGLRWLRFSCSNISRTKKIQRWPN
jgi:hypothetical protein